MPGGQRVQLLDGGAAVFQGGQGQHVPDEGVLGIEIAGLEGANREEDLLGMQGMEKLEEESGDNNRGLAR